MTAAKINGSEASVAKLFGDDYVFHIPDYQRPYAWEADEARTLLSDLVEAQEADSQEPYFLGSVVLIKQDEPDADVVDGQQRLTTLTLLLSVLRRHLPAKNAAALDKQLFQEGDVNLGVEDRPRLQLRERDRDFFLKHVQERSGLEDLLGPTPPAIKTDAQRNLLNNARALDADLAALPPQQAQALVGYLLTRTVLVVVTTPTLDSAHRIFSVLNDRGKPLTYTDILKAEFNGRLPIHLRGKYAEQWEDAEELVEREGFEDLFTNYRMIRVKAKAQKTNLAEWREQILKQLDDPQGLLDELLGPYTEAYRQLLGRSYTAPTGAEKVNDFLRWLHQLDNVAWQPPALLALRRWGQDSAALTVFLRRLERLAASMFIRRVDASRRIRRYGDLLAAMEQMATVSDLDGGPLDLTAEEQSDTVTRLAGDLYLSGRTRLFVLLRLDAALAGDAGVTFTPKYQTVEHVLPQSPATGSEWRQLFTDEQREAWVHKLGNLVLLTRAKNSEAQNYDFDKKKEKYFSAKNGVAMFATTTQVLSQPTWTPAVLLQRQKAQLDVLCGVWDLAGGPTA